MSNKAPQRVLIVENHGDVRLALNFLLNQQRGMISVGEADNVTDLISLLTLTNADFIILDWELIDSNQAKEFVTAIKARPNPPRIIAMSMNSKNEQFIRSIGIEGFVNKRGGANLIEIMQVLNPRPHN